MHANRLVACRPFMNRKFYRDISNSLSEIRMFSDKVSYVFVRILDKSYNLSTRIIAPHICTLIKFVFQEGFRSKSKEDNF